MASVEKDSTSKFDKLPVVVQAILGVLSLALITAAGFGVYFLFDVLLLDLDPIGSLFRAIF